MRVLVVEDEADLADSLRRGLTAEGYTVDIATDGTTGLLLAGSGIYELIILDLMLPGHNGYQICRRLRAAHVTTPILVLTAKDGIYDHAEALDSPADDYLTKPFAYPVLLAHLRALDRRRTAVLSTELVVGDLILDTVRRVCRRAGQAIELTPREFALLEVLMRRPGAVLGKDEILLRAWPGEPEDVNLVEARMSGLRRKVDTAFGRGTLRTVRGAGYQIVDDRGGQ